MPRRRKLKMTKAAIASRRRYRRKKSKKGGFLGPLFRGLLGITSARKKLQGY